jgi:NAD(P)-dependent dehydrogenase (short-subunit alcohol dehydrogenase family)
MARLEGEVAHITGGSRGTGEFIVRMYAREGAKVVFTGRRGENGERIEADIRAAGGEAWFRPVDMLDPQQTIASLAFTAKSFGRITILVNHAAPLALLEHDGAPTAVEDDHWRTLIEGHLTCAAFIPCKYGIPYLQAAGGGAIVQSSSMTALQAGATIAYSSAKAAQIAFIRNLAFVHAKDNIRANTMVLGYTPGPSTAGIPEIDEQYRRNTPLGSGRLEDVAPLAVYLGSKESRFLTGQTIVLDGGLSSYIPGSMDQRLYHVEAGSFSGKPTA